MWDGGVRVTVNGKSPKVAPDAFIAPNATLVGDVTVESGASVWFGAVLRADDGPIWVGPGANVQDNVVIHVGYGRGTTLEEDVTVAHSAVLHTCHIKRGAVIGMGASVLEGAVVGEGALVAANALVTEGFEVPDGCMASGVPARVVGPNGQRARQIVAVSAQFYRDAVERYRKSATWKQGV